MCKIWNTLFKTCLSHCIHITDDDIKNIFEILTIQSDSALKLKKK